MADAKGAQKFAEEYLVGTIGIFYAGLATIFLTFKNPARMSSGNRPGKENAIKVLPASVAMLLFMFPIIFLLRDANGSDTTSIHELLSKFELSGLTWYAKLLAITILFIACDCLVRLASWLLSRDDRRYQRNCERLRYAVAAFAATGNCVILSILALNESNRSSLLGFLQLSTLVFVGTYPAAFVLNSLIRTRFGIRSFSKKALAFLSSWIFSWLGAGIAFAIFGGCWMLIFDAKVPEKKPASAIVSQLQCLLTPEGQIAVSALIENNGGTPIFFGPDEFILTLSHVNPKYDPSNLRKDLRFFPYDPFHFNTGHEDFSKHRLRTESNFATLLKPTESKLWTFTVPPTVTPSLPLRSAKACLLERDNSIVVEYPPNIGFGPPSIPFTLKSSPTPVRCFGHKAYPISDSKVTDVCQ